MVSTPVLEPEPAETKPMELAPERREAAAGPSAAGVEILPSRPRSEPVELKPEPIIPLVHAPDDPGPDAVEASEPPAEAGTNGWRKILG
jgi:HemY protein